MHSINHRGRVGCIFCVYLQQTSVMGAFMLCLESLKFWGFITKAQAVKFQWLLSWLLQKRLSSWAQKITCQCFDWILQSSSGWKWKKCEQTLLLIAMHYMRIRVIGDKHMVTFFLTLLLPLPPLTLTTNHNLSLHLPSSHTNAYHYSFFCDAVQTWNSIPYNSVMSLPILNLRLHLTNL